MGRESAHFGDNLPRRARILVSANVWHDAVAAAVVASDENRDKRLETAFDMRRKRVGHHVLAKLETREPAIRDDFRN